MHQIFRGTIYIIVIFFNNTIKSLHIIYISTPIDLQQVNRKYLLPVNGSMSPYLIVCGNIRIRADSFFTRSIVSTSISLKCISELFIKYKDVRCKSLTLQILLNTWAHLKYRVILVAVSFFTSSDVSVGSFNVIQNLTLSPNS